MLDVGSGSDPFPYASVVVDRYLEPTEHRHSPFNSQGKLTVVADVQNLPFADKSFDFVYCSHVLEHVDHPATACQELMRVGKQGYVETPTLAKDGLFLSARNVHKWHVVSVANALCFFEYSDRQLDGIRSRAWKDIIKQRRYHPLQKVVADNQDFFNVMFSWVNEFQAYVFRLNGSVDVVNGRSDGRL